MYVGPVSDAIDVRDGSTPVKPLHGKADSLTQDHRYFDGGAYRDVSADKLDYDGFLSAEVISMVQDFAQQERDNAWAAGLFEGEGCITILKGGGKQNRVRKDGSRSSKEYRYPRLCMSLTDEDILRRFKSIMGGTIRGPYTKPNRKPIWYWQLSGKAVYPAAQKLLPYLGRRRAERLVEVLGTKEVARAAGIPPEVFERYARYMHANRRQSDGVMRDSDNWKQGIPKDVYVKSLYRHFMDVWALHNGSQKISSTQDIQEALCAVIFNAMGYLFEDLEGR
jgi:hypothetical protein